MIRIAAFLVVTAHAINVDVFSADDHDTSGLAYSCFRIPALMRSKNGTLFAFAEGRRGSCSDHGDVRLLQRISNDDGLSWSPIGQVKAEEGHTIGNPAPIADARTGVMHLLYSRDNQQVFVTQSSDGGATWSPSANLTSVFTDVPVGFVGTGPPGGIQLSDGRLITAMYYNCPGEGTTDCPQGSTRSLALYSDDAGTTWKRSANVQPGPTVYMGGESQVARFGTAGDLAMLTRVRGDFPSKTSLGHPAVRAVDHNHALAISKDGGVTWSNSTLLHLQSSYCEGSIVATPSGAVLVSAPSTNNGGRANLTVWASNIDSSGKVAFDYQTTIYRGSAAYSSLLPSLRKGTYLNLFERENSGYLTLVDFNYTATREMPSMV